MPWFLHDTCCIGGKRSPPFKKGVVPPFSLTQTHPWKRNITHPITTHWLNISIMIYCMFRVQVSLPTIFSPASLPTTEAFTTTCTLWKMVYQPYLQRLSKGAPKTSLEIRAPSAKLPCDEIWTEFLFNQGLVDLRNSEMQYALVYLNIMAIRFFFLTDKPCTRIREIRYVMYIYGGCAK